MPKEPRDGSVVLGGHPWLARMIDKARLEAAGEIDDFDLEFPCPMDRSLLSRLGINAKEFQQIVTTHQSDGDVLKALVQQGVSVSTV